MWVEREMPVMKIDPCNENRVPCNENRFFPVKNMYYTGKTLFWPCTGPVRDCSVDAEGLSQMILPEPNLETLY